MHELSDVPAETGDQLPRQYRREKPQHRILPHVFDPVRGPFDGVDVAGFEVVLRLFDHSSGAGEGELGDDLGGKGPERIIRVDTGRLAEAQYFSLHELILVVDETLQLEDTGPREHGIHQLASLAMELWIVLSEHCLVGAKRIVIPRVFEVFCGLAVDDLVEADIVEMELVGSDAKSVCVYQSVSRSVIPRIRAYDIYSLYSL